MKKIKTFDEHLDKQYGKKGTPKRDQFDTESMAFRWGKMMDGTKKKAVRANKTHIG